MSALRLINGVGPGGTTDVRAVINAAGTQRAATTWYTGRTGSTPNRYMISLSHGPTPNHSWDVQALADKES